MNQKILYLVSERFLKKQFLMHGKSVLDIMGAASLEQ
jgi:hypothetical protein